ncbi:NADAR family protein [Roseateles sp. UC29_93]|uniref:NADAR family protein n=1 Tax=Roseateles sp. UC29_93 TaxID=3350177 RepID=UPI0036706B3A
MNQASEARDVRSLVESLQAGRTAEYILFWGHRPPKDRGVNASCFSQWYDASFQVGTETFRTAEHFMMAAKAMLFGDQVLRQQILEAKTPDLAKQLGRQVAGFDERRWAEHRFDIVVAANMGKFGGNGPLRRFLLGTGDQVLVEASPVDSVWGIGLAANDADARNPAQWKGLNLLGFALMEVRARLKAAKETTEP